MSHNIIPTILVQDRLEFEQRLGIMQGKIPVAQMDIMDGKFVGNTTYTNPKIAARYNIAYELDLMVADPDPVLEKWHDTLPQPPPIPAPEQARYGAGKGGGKVVRAFVHVEIIKPLAPLLEKIKSYGWEAGIAINPDTEWEVVKQFLPFPHTPSNSPSERGRKNLSSPACEFPPRPEGGHGGVGGRGGRTFVDCVLFMTVYPGQNAAPFQAKVIPKIQKFHDAYPNVPIEVDGGVSEATLPLLLKAGVTRFAVGSAIWSAPDPLHAYKKLLKVVDGFNRGRRT